MKIKTEEWSPDHIADGILTWCTWPGFEGTHCDQCKCSMNVMGMSYGHRCPECDPEGKHYVMHSMHHMGRMPFKDPRFGPTLETIRAGSRRAMEISESQRKYLVGTPVIFHEYWYGRACPLETGTVVGWDKDSYPSMRYYEIDVGGQERKQLESNMAPFRKFADGEAVLIKDEKGWASANIVCLVNDEKSHFVYRQHWYDVALLGRLQPASSMIHKSIFDGSVHEGDIRSISSVNPDCRWCNGAGKITLATTVQNCLDCWS